MQKKIVQINLFVPQKLIFTNHLFLQVKISEGTKVGTEVTEVQATDDDAGKNGIVTYSLMNDKDTFKMGTVSSF
jgi:hypothetical protein